MRWCLIKYGKIRKETPVFKYSVGDVVRVSKVRGIFTKGYEQNYTEEYFTITACIPRVPPVYRLQDLDGEIIDGCFYEEELQKIIVSDDKTFKIEKILHKQKRGKVTYVLVKWWGWPSKFNSWIAEKEVMDLQGPLKP